MMSVTFDLECSFARELYARSILGRVSWKQRVFARRIPRGKDGRAQGRREAKNTEEQAQKKERRLRPPPITSTNYKAYAALLCVLASSIFSLPKLTLICLGLASIFFASFTFNTPLS